MHMQFADYLVHISNIMLLVSYSVRDILWLRWFAVGAALINIPYFPSRERALATGSLGTRIHRNQPVSDHAHLSRASFGCPLRGRTQAV